MATLTIGDLTMSGTDDEVIGLFKSITTKMRAGESISITAGDGPGSKNRAFFIPPTIVEVDLERPFTDAELASLHLSAANDGLTFDE